MQSLLWRLQRDREEGDRDCIISLAVIVSLLAYPRLRPSLFAWLCTSSGRDCEHNLQIKCLCVIIQLLQKGPARPPVVFFADADTAYTYAFGTSCVAISLACACSARIGTQLLWRLDIGSVVLVM